MVLIADNVEDFYQSYFEDLAVEYCEHVKNAPKPHFYVNNFLILQESKNYLYYFY
jgi:hypothetical protein